MSHFEGKTWLRHDKEGGVHVYVYDGPVASLLDTPIETYIQTDAGWTDESGEPVDAVVQDDLDVLIAPVDAALDSE